MHNVWPEPAAASGAMRVPVRRWAGLWPWMLMAGLEVVLGHTGLELAAAVETERALIKVTLLKQESTSRPIITLEGVFAGGSAGSARGKLMQVRPGRCSQKSYPIILPLHIMNQIALVTLLDESIC